MAKIITRGSKKGQPQKRTKIMDIQEEAVKTGIPASLCSEPLDLERAHEFSRTMEGYQDRKLKQEKMQKYAEALELYQENRFERLCECGDYLRFLLDEEKEKAKLERANFCGIRLCPVCMYKKSRKEGFKIAVVMDAIEKKEGKQFIMVTFTAPNVKAKDLQNEIKKYNDAFRYLVQKVPEVQKICKGYIRKLEITFNEKRGDYHPHIHVLMAVNKSYFKDRTYLSSDKWLHFWRRVMRDDTITQVDVRKAYRSINKKSGAYEISKYVAISNDYTYSQKVFEVFHWALKGRRLITTSGLFKDYFELFEKGDLEEFTKKDETYYKYLISFDWKKAESFYKKRYTGLAKNDSDAVAAEAEFEANRLKLDQPDQSDQPDQPDQLLTGPELPNPTKSEQPRPQESPESTPIPKSTP